MNKISKTTFIKGINCPRYFYLYDEYLKAKGLKSPDLKEIYQIEDLGKYNSNLKDNDQTELDFEDFELHKEDIQMNLLLPYFNKVEELSATYFEHLFEKKVHFHYETKHQKMFSANISNYEFYAFLDGYQELDNEIHIIETKATTSKKFFSLNYTENKEKYTIFEEDSHGILKTRQALGLTVDKNYNEKIKSILNRNHNCGNYIYDLAYQRFIIEKSSQNKNSNIKYYLSVLNHKYIFDGIYKNNEPDYLKDIDEKEFIIKVIDVTDLTLMMQPIIKKDIETVMMRLDNKFESYQDKTLCPSNGKHKCDFHEFCYKDFPKKYSILTYIGRHFGFKNESNDLKTLNDFYLEKKVHMLDIPFNYLNREINRIQYLSLKEDKPFIDNVKIKEILSKIKLPIYYLDFESFNCPLPRFKGEKPYDQSLFQFNLHIEKELGKVDLISNSFHYLSTNNLDNRKELVEKLLEYIDDSGTIIVWNESFEKKRLEELANIFPEFKHKLDALNENIYDLMALFKGTDHRLYKDWKIEKPLNVLYYHKDMQGSFSIKKVLPIFNPEMNYENLNVQNGIMAMVNYANLPNLNKEDLALAIDDLVKYCRQDTYAMVKLLHSLRKSI